MQGRLARRKPARLDPEGPRGGNCHDSVPPGRCSAFLQRSRALLPGPPAVDQAAGGELRYRPLLVRDSGSPHPVKFFPKFSKTPFKRVQAASSWSQPRPASAESNEECDNAHTTTIAANLLQKWLGPNKNGSAVGPTNG